MSETDNERILELLLALSNKDSSKDRDGGVDKNTDAICELWDIAAASSESAYFAWQCKAIPLLMGTALNAAGYTREVCLGAIRAVASPLLSSSVEAHSQAGKALCCTKELAQLCAFIALNDADAPTLCEACRIALHCLCDEVAEESRGLWIDVFGEERVLDKIVFWVQNTYDTQLIACASKLAYGLSYYDDSAEKKEKCWKRLCDAGLCEVAVGVLEENIVRLDPISGAVGPLLSFLLLAAENGHTGYASNKVLCLLNRVKGIIHSDPEFEEAERVLDDLLTFCLK